MTENRRFQDGDYVIHNEYKDRPDRDSEGRVIQIYTEAGQSRGDWAYTVEFTGGYNVRSGSGRPWRTQVWGWTLRQAMFKYDPKQAGDTDEDI